MPEIDPTDDALLARLEDYVPAQLIAGQWWPTLGVPHREAAARIRALLAALRRIDDGDVDWSHKPADEMRDIASHALRYNSCN